MNYDRNSGLRASEQDADDEFDGGAQSGGDEQQDNGAQDDAGDDADDGSQDDQADADEQDDSQDDDQLSAGEQQQRRRGIQQRADQVRGNTDFDPVRLASETAAATARATAQANAEMQRQADTERQEREALAAMTDEQKATYLLAKETAAVKSNQARTEVLLRSSSDQHAFSRVLTRKPQFAKYEQEVENRHQAMLAQGQFVSRELVLQHLIGERALKNENAQAQRQNAQRRVQGQRNVSTGRGGRGDAGGAQGGNARPSVVQRAEREDWAI